MKIRCFKLYLFINFFTLISVHAQKGATIYLFPGQGSDQRIFDGLELPNDQKIVHIKYPLPQKGSSLKEFAQSISRQVDTSEAYLFIGVSLGGMIITELNEFLDPELAIIISSAKSKKELPIRYRIQKVIPIYRMVPPKLMLAGAKLLQPIVEPDRNTYKATFKNMLASKDPLYLKRTVAMIIQWQRKKALTQIIHIHGTKDRTIPFRNVQANHIINGGSHMMTLTEAGEINKVLNSYFKQ